jgi:hypothetical protein
VALPVLLRVGVHDEYDRLVFDWPEGVAFELDAATLDSARVRFAVPGRLDASVLAKTRVGRLRKMTASDSADGLVVALSFAPGVTARAFSLGQRVVVDLAGPKGALRLATFERQERAVPTPPGGAPVPLFSAAAEPDRAADKPATGPGPDADAAAKAATGAEEAAAPPGPQEPLPPPTVRVSEPTGFQLERLDVFGRQVATRRAAGLRRRGAGLDDAPDRDPRTRASAARAPRA